MMDAEAEMAAIQSKKMNWVKTQSTYQSMQAWRAKRKAAQEEFEARMTAVTNAFNAAFSNRIQGIGELAAQQALARIGAEAQARIDASTKSIDVTA